MVVYELDITGLILVRNGEQVLWFTDPVEAANSVSVYQAEAVVQNQLYVKNQMTAAIAAMLNAKAQELRYDNIMSARSYAGYANPFQVEALKLAEWSSACWIKASTIEVDVMAGNRVAPSLSDLLLEMPKLMV